MWGRLKRYRRKHAAIYRYLRLLPGLLEQEFGESRYYEPAQIERTVERLGLGTEFIEYAMAMYATVEDFDALPRAVGQPGYWRLRGEIAKAHFRGDADFSPVYFGGSAESAGHGHCSSHGWSDGGGGGHGH